MVSMATWNDLNDNTVSIIASFLTNIPNHLPNHVPNQFLGGKPFIHFLYEVDTIKNLNKHYGILKIKNIPNHKIPLFLKWFKTTRNLSYISFNDTRFNDVSGFDMTLEGVEFNQCILPSIPPINVELEMKLSECSGFVLEPHTANTSMTRLCIEQSKIPVIHANAFFEYLQTLIIKQCHVTEIIGSFALNNLTAIILYNNQLSTWPDVSRCPQLKYLDLHDNMISHIPNHALTACHELQTLYMAHNQLTHLPQRMCMNQRMTVIDFSENPLQVFLTRFKTKKEIVIYLDCRGGHLKLDHLT